MQYGILKLMGEIRELYISVDVEADGPYPNPYSMVSLGAAVAGYRDVDGSIVRINIDDKEFNNTFYAEFKPLTDQWVEESLAVSGISREQLELNGSDPATVMTEFASWVETQTLAYECKTAVFCAFPLGFDWMWVYWYLMKFSATGSPFGHSRCLDIKTLYMAKAKTTLTRSTKQNMPKILRSSKPHTHNALDDAIEQGDLMMNIMEWQGK